MKQHGGAYIRSYLSPESIRAQPNSQNSECKGRNSFLSSSHNLPCIYKFGGHSPNQRSKLSSNRGSFMKRIELTLDKVAESISKKSLDESINKRKSLHKVNYSIQEFDLQRIRKRNKTNKSDPTPSFPAGYSLSLHKREKKRSFHEIKLKLPIPTMKTSNSDLNKQVVENNLEIARLSELILDIDTEIYEEIRFPNVALEEDIDIVKQKIKIAQQPLSPIRGKLCCLDSQKLKHLHLDVSKRKKILVELEKEQIGLQDKINKHKLNADAFNAYSRWTKHKQLSSLIDKEKKAMLARDTETRKATQINNLAIKKYGRLNERLKDKLRAHNLALSKSKKYLQDIGSIKQLSAQISQLETYLKMEVMPDLTCEYGTHTIAERTNEFEDIEALGEGSERQTDRQRVAIEGSDGSADIPKQEDSNDPKYSPKEREKEGKFSRAVKRRLFGTSPPEDIKGFVSDKEVILKDQQNEYKYPMTQVRKPRRKLNTLKEEIKLNIFTDNARLEDDNQHLEIPIPNKSKVISGRDSIYDRRLSSSLMRVTQVEAHSTSNFATSDMNQDRKVLVLFNS